MLDLANFVSVSLVVLIGIWHKGPIGVLYWYCYTDDRSKLSVFWICETETASSGRQEVSLQWERMRPNGSRGAWDKRSGSGGIETLRPYCLMFILFVSVHHFHILLWARQFWLKKKRKVYFWLCWVCAGSLLLCKGFLEVRRAGTTLQLWCLGLLRSTGSRHEGFGRRGPWAQ